MFTMPVPFHWFLLNTECVWNWGIRYTLHITILIPVNINFRNLFLTFFLGRISFLLTFALYVQQFGTRWTRTCHFEGHLLHFGFTFHFAPYLLYLWHFNLSFLVLHVGTVVQTCSNVHVGLLGIWSILVSLGFHLGFYLRFFKGFI